MAASRVRTRRRELGVSQRELSALAGVSRQALNAIESGRSSPSVNVALRIAEALRVTVERLFGDAPASWTVSATRLPQATTPRRVLGWVHGRWVAHDLADREHDVACDGMARERTTSIDLFRPPVAARENVIVMGCAPFLGILCDRLNTEHGSGRFVWLPRTSKDGIKALLDGRTHLAGTHFTDERGHEANAAHLRKQASRMDTTLITLAHWEVGLVVARGNPKGLRRAADVARRGIRVVNREKGASPRRVFERSLRIDGVNRPTYAMTVKGHLNIARAIAFGAAGRMSASRCETRRSRSDSDSSHSTRRDSIWPSPRSRSPMRVFGGFSISSRRSRRGLNFPRLVTTCATQANVPKSKPNNPPDDRFLSSWPRKDRDGYFSCHRTRHPRDGRRRRIRPWRSGEDRTVPAGWRRSWWSPSGAQTTVGDVLYPIYLRTAKPTLRGFSAGSRSVADVFDVKEHLAFFALVLAIAAFVLTRTEPKPTPLLRVLFEYSRRGVILVAALGFVVWSIKAP